MATYRRDKIMKEIDIAENKHKITDIDKLFGREYDFKEHQEIFDFKNEYANNYKFAAQMYNFQNMDSTFKTTCKEKINDPMYRLGQKTETSNMSKLGNVVNVVMVNMGFDTVLNDCSRLNAENLYCDEKLPSDLETSISDPFAQSDDDKDKDYLPEDDLCGSVTTDDAEEKEMFTTSVNINDPLLKSNINQHCEFEKCNLKPISSCEKCSCLLCTVHFFDQMQIITCEKHYPFSTENCIVRGTEENAQIGNKENDFNFINLLNYDKLEENNTNHKYKTSETYEDNTTIKNLTKNYNVTDKQTPLKNKDNLGHTHCEYTQCNDEVFSACGRCLSFLCFVHFENEHTFNDCHNHQNKNTTGTHDLKKASKVNKVKKRLTRKNTQEKEILLPLDETINEKNNKEVNEEINKENEYEINKENNKSAVNSIAQEESRRSESLHLINCDKGLTKEGNLRKRRKIEEPVEERKRKKTENVIEKLTLKDPCTESCRKKCRENISEKRRKEINNEYVSLKWESKGCYIKSLVETKKVACRTTDTEQKKRNVTYAYYFYEDKTKIEVCKTFFLTTLGYNPKNDNRLMLALQRPIAKQNYQTGKYSRKSKFDKDLIKTHAMSKYNPVNSHYRREHAPNRLYLPSDITITSMHKQFCADFPEQIVSFDVYRKIIREEMNISFAHLGNEECEICAQSKHHDRHETETEVCEFCKKFDIHKSKYTQARKSYKKDVKKSEKNTNSIYYSVDLQKVVMLPRMEQFKRAIFCSRIIAFNESFVPLGKCKNDNIPFAAVWNESVSGRKQEDIISAFMAFLLQKRDADHIVLWMDNCSSQNKNWALLSFVVYVINSNLIKAKSITLKYLEPGHTFMSADSFHHQVEHALKKKVKVYDFADFVAAVQHTNSGKNYVKTMEVRDFNNYFDLSSQHKVRKMEPRAYLKDIMVIVASRGEFKLQYKMNHDDEDWQFLDFLQKKYTKTGSFPQFSQKTTPRGVPESTKQGIKKLLDLMPDNRKDFWLNLPISDNVPSID